jgi:hypothetical protein
MKKIIFFLIIILSFMNITYGGQLMIGLTFDDIHFWRFWQSDRGILNEKVLILNERKEGINVSLLVDKIVDFGTRVMVFTDSSLGIVGGPWQIPANGYKVFDMPKLPDSIEANKSYLYEVLCGKSDQAGLMYIHNEKPKGTFQDNRIITNMEVDGGPGAEGKYWWEQSSLYTASGEKVMVRFSFIPENSDSKEKDNKYSLFFTNPPDSIIKLSNELVKLIKVTRGYIPFVPKVDLQDGTESYMGSRFTFPQSDKTFRDDGVYSVDFILEAPITTSTEFRSFNCSLRIGDTKYRHLRLPLIVLPK